MKPQNKADKELISKIDKLQNEINTFRPIPEKLLNQLKEYYKIGLTYTSNAIEGNSLTESETKIVLEEGITIGGKPLKDHYEAIGHSESYNFMYKLSKSKQITESNIRKLHKLFYYRINEKEAGKYRTEKVIITGSRYLVSPPEKIKGAMKNFISDIEKINKNYHPVEAAGLIHKEFVFIHPFIDGNGRVARLLMNLVLLQNNYTIAIIPPILRAEYISLLEKAHKNDKDFINFIAERVIETQKDYLRFLK